MKKTYIRVAIITLLLVLLYCLAYFYPVINGWYQQGIHKINLYDSNRESILNTEQPIVGGKTVLYNDEIFFINDANNGFIYSINLKDGNEKLIVDQNTDSMCIANNKIYFSNLAGINSVNLDGSNIKTLDGDTKPISNIVISDSNIYLANRLVHIPTIYLVRKEHIRYEKLLTFSVKR
jgi:hypothetical protein